ncbi:MAG: deoxyribose-phosphate aldolase [Firmicutes bacterium]|nr:deoxyribose-phosphate aldolase [Bacillota bacterium]
MIDHTLLKATAKPEEIDRLCQEARDNGFGAVCVNPAYVPRAVKALQGNGVAVATVVGFPLGANQPEIKAAEARLALQQGASELDMVINIGALKGGDPDLVERDIRAVVNEARAAGGKALVKVIIETCYLTDDEKRTACRLAKQAGADFVKTSTGFGTGGATVEDVRLMRQAVGPEMGVKAAGGMRSTADALAMVEAGASRLGTSAGVAIAAGLAD